jgi:hypothetical protein
MTSAELITGVGVATGEGVGSVPWPLSLQVAQKAIMHAIPSIDRTLTFPDTSPTKSHRQRSLRFYVRNLTPQPPGSHTQGNPILPAGVKVGKGRSYGHPIAVPESPTPLARNPPGVPHNPRYLAAFNADEVIPDRRSYTCRLGFARHPLSQWFEPF